jgi:PAS domain S-box-containing protein
LDAAVDLGLTAFDELNDVFFFVKDRDRRFVYFNKAFTALMSLSPEQIVGQRDEDLSPAYLAEHYREDDEAVLTRGERLVGVIELVHNADGSYDWFTTTKFPVLSASGEIIGVAGVTRSLTKRTAAQERLLPLEPAIRLMSEHYDRPLRVSDMARAATMSPTHFARRFKAQFGISPHRYLGRLRIAAACDLLSTTDLLVGDIAGRVGYYDQSHLTKAFTRSKGVTPAEYRKRSRMPTRTARPLVLAA